MKNTTFIIRNRIPGIILLWTFLAIPATGQSYLGLDGGFEGSAVIDNENTYAAGQSAMWTKANANQTIARESSIARSGSNSLKIINTSTTGRRCFTPTFSPTAGQRLVMQYYRRVSGLTDTQVSHCEVSRDGTTSSTSAQSMTYTTPTSAEVWEKVTFAPTSTDFIETVWADIMHKQTGNGGPLYIDDVAIYTATGVDNTPPDAPSNCTAGTITSSSIALSWTAPATGTDDGGYLVIRGEDDTTTAPNVNGIYAVNNSIGSGKVVYQGTDNRFTDSELTPNTGYFYRIYTYDKAYNYSDAVSANATTAVSTAVDMVPGNAVPTDVRYFTINGMEVTNPGKGVFVEKSYYNNKVVTRKIVR